jgi:hypothetical protein
MAITRPHGSAQALVPEIDDGDALSEIELTAGPSPVWRTDFLRLPIRLTSRRYTLDTGRLTIRGATFPFRTDPERHLGRLRRIDRWIQYVHSIVDE